MITFQRIKQLAQQFPGAIESTSYGTPSIKVGKKLVLRMHQKEDAIVMMLESVAEQQALIQEDPMAFYITDHYQGYAAILIRPTVEENTLFELMERAWRRVASARERDAYDAPG